MSLQRIVIKFGEQETGLPWTKSLFITLAKKGNLELQNPNLQNC